MKTRRRIAIALAIFIALFAPFAAISPASAQAPLDGSTCWQPGQLTISGAQMTWSAPPATIIDLSQSYSATLQTTAGAIRIALDAANAPLATNNFICLALAGYYTGTDFHRIFANTMIQGGDPTASGAGNPGYTIPSDPTLGHYPAGSVSMANASPDRNGSQFFIAATDLTGLIPNDYPVFGQVTAGMDVVLAISNGAVTTTATGEQSKPVEPSILMNVSISTGTQDDAPAGPVIVTPTPTAVLSAITGDVQARPGSMPPPGDQPSVAVETGCAGLDEYTTAFDDTYVDTALQNSEAFDFLISLQEGDGSESMFEQMSASQAAAMSAFYSDLADAISRITPPAFATEWHTVQIEIFRALGEFTGNIASQGLTLASIQASPVLEDLIERSDTALANATAECAGFQTWATGESES